MGTADDLDEVLTGQSGDLRWVVRAGLVREGVIATFLDVFRGDRLIDSGGGTSPIALESMVNFSYGYSDDSPVSVVARCAVGIDRLVAVTDSGREVVMKLSEPVERFGTRFGACILPSLCHLARISAWSRDELVFEGTARFL